MGNMHGGRIAAVVDSRKSSKILQIYFYSFMDSFLDLC